MEIDGSGCAFDYSSENEGLKLAYRPNLLTDLVKHADSFHLSEYSDTTETRPHQTHPIIEINKCSDPSIFLYCCICITKPFDILCNGVIHVRWK